MAGFWEGRYKATWKREFKLPWRAAGQPNHLDDKVYLDQQVVNKELSLSLWPGIWQARLETDSPA